MRRVSLNFSVTSRTPESVHNALRCGFLTPPRNDVIAAGVHGVHRRASRRTHRLCRCTVVALLLSSACSDEVARVRSPNGLTDAVLMEDGGNATVSPGYEIYLTRAGGSWIWGTEVAGLYAAARNDSAWGVNLRWTSNDSLRIEFLHAEAVNRFISPIWFHGRSVFASLDSGIVDPGAPRGSMFYSQQRLQH